MPRYVLENTSVVIIRNEDRQIVDSYTIAENVAIDTSGNQVGEIVDSVVKDVSKHLSENTKRMLEHVANGCVFE